MSGMRCPDCGGKMRMEGDMWVCTRCDTAISTSFDEDPDYDDMPEGCAACGGNWPDCESSCPMFDD